MTQTLRLLLLRMKLKQQMNQGTYYLVFGFSEFTVDLLLNEQQTFIDRPATEGSWYIDVDGVGRFTLQWVSPAQPRRAA